MDAGEMFDNAINHWRDEKGIGTALIPAPLNSKLMVLGVLQRVYSRSPTCKTVIVVRTFNERTEMSEYLTQQEDQEENNSEFKKLIKEGYIKIFTLNYIEDCVSTSYPTLCIIYKPDRFDGRVQNYISRCKFKLIVLTRLIEDAEAMRMLYHNCPLLSDFAQNQIDEVRVSTPVEEIRCPVYIEADSENAKLLEYYNEYISTSVSIFGNFEIMQQAHLGNNQLNISSMQICNQIAHENGWNENLDMSVEFNLEIDRLYNPNNLKERASMTYEIVRNRNQLLSDYDAKLDAVFKIVKDNPDKKILIINKRAEFASTVTEYINMLSEKSICMNYHDKVNNILAVDVDGNPVVYKSGLKKGQQKTIGAKAQKTLAVAKFNADEINVISTNNAPDKDLCIDVDMIIITSPQCNDIKSYLYRLDKLCFRSHKLKLYTLYIRGSSEQKLLERKEMALNHIVKNDVGDENISDFIVDD